MSETSSAQITVVDAPDHGRFEIFVDGELAGFSEYVERPDVRVFPHTVIEEEFGGRGLATVLVRAALDQTRASGRSVLPLCPVVRGFIAKNPDYLDLVPESRRGELGLG
jgi:predicted GNAT family acetyltransferase